MKIQCLKICLTILFLSFSFIPANADWSIGNKACVQWEDDLWYHAEITDISEDHIRVHYTGYDQSYDEWVRKGTALEPHAPQVDDVAWVFWKQSSGNSFFYEGRILEKNSTGYKVHYVVDGEDSTWDEWKGLCDVFPLPQPGDYLWVGPSSLSWAYGKVIEHTDTDTWKARYGGYSIESWSKGQWYEYDDTFSPPDIVPTTPKDQESIQEAFSDHSPVAPPTGVKLFTFNPAASPDILDSYHVTTPSKIKTIGLGEVVTGGETISVSFDVPNFTEEMNFYFAVVLASMPNDIFLFGKDHAWHSYKTEGLIPAVENKTWSSRVDVLQNVSISKLPETTYRFYLAAAKGYDLSNSYIWLTTYTKNQTGYFSGNTNSCLSSDIIAMAQQITAEMETKGSAAWYDELETFISDYRDEDDEPNPTEALNMIALAAYGENNVYPFCWAAFKGVEESPASPTALNAAAVCLFELGKNQDAGKILDCALRYDPDLSISYANGAVYHANNNNVTSALEAYKTALGKSPENPHTAWNAYHYALRNNRTDYQSLFLSYIPENYSIKNNDNTTGTGEKELIVCCNCNGGIYHDLGTCLDECTVSLACFTHICSPRLDCCNGNGPFSFGGGVCYPPTGVQVCLDLDSQENVSIKVGVNLGNIFSGYIGASTNFANNHSLFLEGSTGATKHKLTIVTTDPNTGNWSSQHQLTGGTSFGGVSFGANTEPATWSKSMLCELYAQ